jgi:NADPH2:quinone reductase
MRAVIVSEYGGSPHVEDLPPPEVQAGQVLIEVLAAGMNPGDRQIAAGNWDSIMPATFPMILGADVVGRSSRSARPPSGSRSAMRSSDSS